MSETIDLNATAAEKRAAYADKRRAATLAWFDAIAASRVATDPPRPEDGRQQAPRPTQGPRS